MTDLCLLQACFLTRDDLDVGWQKGRDVFDSLLITADSTINSNDCTAMMSGCLLQACFLTRGDLYVSWEKGRDVFDRLLIDGDASINSGNWMWLSASSFFYQYFRVYSPVTYGKKYDPEGRFVRHFLPVLKVGSFWTVPYEVLFLFCKRLPTLRHSQCWQFCLGACCLEYCSGRIDDAAPQFARQLNERCTIEAKHI